MSFKDRKEEMSKKRRIRLKKKTLLWVDKRYTVDQMLFVSSIEDQALGFHIQAFMNCSAIELWTFQSRPFTRGSLDVYWRRAELANGRRYSRVLWLLVLLVHIRESIQWIATSSSIF